MYFEIVGLITDIETIAVGKAIRELPRLRRRHGRRRWRKLKGVATVRLARATSGGQNFTGTRRTELGVFG
jgi:hypothetical protein